MRKSLSVWQMTGFVFTGITGTLLHFVYGWTGEQPLAGLLSATNESIWEHMKLLYVPMVIFAAAESRLSRVEEEKFWWIKLFGMLTGLVLIPTLYYTYTGALGVFWDWFNIAIFFIAAMTVFWLETVLFQRWKCRLRSSWVPLALLLLIGSLFVIFTFFPPKIPLFAAPGK